MNMVTLRGLFFLVIMCVALSPLAVFAQGIVPCGNVNPATGHFDQPNAGTPYHPCRFTDFIALARNVINFLIALGVVAAAAGFAYAGYLYITAMGSEEKIRRAHSIFYKVVLGFVFMLSAWLIARTLEDTFLTPGQTARSFLQRGAPSYSEGATPKTPTEQCRKSGRENDFGIRYTDESCR